MGKDAEAPSHALALNDELDQEHFFSEILHLLDRGSGNLGHCDIFGIRGVYAEPIQEGLTVGVDKRRD